MSWFKSLFGFVEEPGTFEVVDPQGARNAYDPKNPFVSADARDMTEEERKRYAVDPRLLQNTFPLGKP